MTLKKTSNKPSIKGEAEFKGNEVTDLLDIEERYKSFVRNFRGIAFQGRMDYTPIFFHGAVEEITGYKEEEFIAGEVRWDHLIHPFDKDESFENIRLIPNYSIEREYRILHKDGNIRWIREFIQNISDDSGKPLMVQGTLYEVTARKQAELALKESEERYRTLAEASHDMIFIINRSDEVEYVNNFAAKQMGFLPKDIIGKKRSTLFPPEIAKNQGINLQNVFKTGNPAHMEGKAIFHDRMVWLDTWLVPLSDKDGRITSIMGISRDISAYKRTEDALRDSESRYRLLFESNPNPMWVYDLETLAFLAVNDAAIAHYGYSLQEFLKLTIKDIRPAEDIPRLIDNVSKVTDGLDEAGRWRHCKKDGTIIDVEITSHTLTFAGRPAEVVLANDITGRKRMEEALRKVQVSLLQAESRAHLGSWELDVATQRGWWSPEVYRLFEYEPAYGAPYFNEFLEKVHPDDRPLILQAHAQAIETAQPTSIDFRSNPGLMALRYFNLISECVRDADGKVIQFVGTILDITERKIAEAILEASENKYSTLVEKGNDGIVLIQDGLIKFSNSRMSEMTGYSREEGIDKPFINYIAPTSRKAVSEIYEKRLAGKDVPNRYELEIVSKNGINIHVEVNASIISYEGRPADMAIIRDITERKKAEDDLYNNDRFLNGIFESIQDGICVLDKDLTIISVNPMVEKWFPHIIPLAGKKCFEAFHGRKERCDVCPGWNSITTRKTAHEIVPKQGPDGKDVGWMEMYTYPMIDTKTGELTGVIEYVRDITERKRAEEKLKLFSEAVETALDGIQIVGLDGRIIYSNKAVEEIYGFSRDEFTGKHVNEMNADPDIAGKFILPSIEKTGRWVGELLVKHKDGRVFPISLSASMVKNDKGEPIAMVGVIKDITERKEAEKKHKESHAFLQSIINGVAEPIMVIDKNYRVKLMNQAAKGGLSEIPDNLCCYQISHHSDKPCINSEHPCPLVEVSRTGHPVTVVHEHVKVNGNKRFYEILASPLYDADGIFSGIIESSRDITERKRVQDALRESELAYRTLAENLPGIVYRIYLRENNIMRFFNKLAQTVTGYREEELSTGEICSIEDIIVPEDRDRVIREVKRAIAENKSFSVEYGLKHKDGSIRYMLEHGTPIYQNGEPLYIDGVIYDNTQRKHVEEELRRSEASLESAQTQVKLGNWDIDPETQTGHWSKEMYRLLNLDSSSKKPTFPEFLKLIHPEDRQNVEDKHIEAFKSEFPIKMEFRGNPAFGLNKYFQGTVEKRRVDKGTKTMLYGTLLDITERKDAEEALKASEKRYRMLFESATDAIFILEAEGENAGHIIDANHAAAQMHGFTNEDLLKMKVMDLDTPESSKDAPNLIRRIMNGERIQKEITHKRKDGTVFPVEINAGLLELGTHRYILAFDRDITERKQWEVALEQSEEKFRNIVEQSGDGIVLTDEEGIIIEWNRAEEKIIGLNRADAIGRPIWDVQFQCAAPEKKTVESDKKLKAILQELLKTGESPILNRLSENDIMRPDGTRRCVQVQVFLVKTDKGFKTGSITRDITESKKAEEEIRKYASDLGESNKMKELFTDIMHHDLLNPLNTVSGFIEILREEEDEPRKKMYFETIERNIGKGVELLENATMLSRLESLQSIEFENIDIADVIESNIENIRPEAEKAGIQIENRITLCMPVRANKIIEEVFSNLFTNAIKYASGGKKIILDSKETDGFWRVNVVDFGDGIKDSDKTLIFERFRRLEKKGVKGSGLGLAIAKKIIELHNGRIWVEDNPEGGAVFVVEIPKNSSV